MSRYRVADHRLNDLVRWDPALPARRINDHILVSPGCSWSYVVTSDDGDVVINAGMPHEAERHRERFEQLLGRPLDVRALVFTQSHADHMGGWQIFRDNDAPIYVHRDFPWLWRERYELMPFFGPRNRRVLPSLLATPQAANQMKPAVEIPDPTLVGDNHAFEVGGRRFEIHSTPSGETLDSLVVWMPGERTLLTGNLMGALPGSLPHFYTARGDRDRSLTRFIVDMDRLLGLAPELLIMGHGEPVAGEAARDYLRRLRDATRHIRDETVRGMNAGQTLHEVMASVRLPADLEHMPGRGRLSWYVRSMWEELTGWFRHQSTTELYETPQQAIWPDLLELAGADRIAKRAADHVTAGKPLEALHLTDIVLAADPQHRVAREAEVAALEMLVENGRGELFDEQGWLEFALIRARAE